MRKIDLKKTLTAYFGFVSGYNSDKSLTGQLRTEVYTGQLLLKLLHDNSRDSARQDCILETNLYSINTMTNIRSAKTILSHLEALKACGVIREFKCTRKGPKPGLYEILFDARFIQLRDDC